ncbi:hypothetical protein T439DRAFT_292608, partial [Meredithblackwellia eburnea MCA 4105]
SCAECVRLKLKCSRVWPCSNCIRRGCGQLCPQDTMAPRDSAKLARKIKALMAENEALRNQAGPSSSAAINIPSSDSPADVPFTLPSAPLISPNLIEAAASSFHPFPKPPSAASTSSPLDKSTPPGGTRRSNPNSLESATGTGPGVLDLEGEPNFLGRGAGALFLIDTEGKDAPTKHQVTSLVFPFMSSDPHIIASLPASLPSLPEVLALISIYQRDVAWMYHPTSFEALQNDISILYRGSDLTANVQDLHPHRLAALLAVLAIAELFSTPRVSEAGPGSSARSIHYFNAASSLLTVNPHNFLYQPSLGAVEALHTMVSFLFCLGDREGAKAAWPLLGLALRTAQSMGLHKDALRWGMDPSEVAERSRIWWETLVYDLLQSLNFGRPYSMPLAAVQCPTPARARAASALSPAPAHADAFHEVKYELGLLFGKVSDLLASSDLPAYEEVLRLDRQLKECEARAPSWLRLSVVGSSGLAPDPSTIPQKHMVSLLLHKALLALHRPFFALAVLAGPEPMLSSYAASFNACIVSARKHIQLMRSLLNENPTAAYRWWFFAFHCFTALIIESSVLLRVPQCMQSEDVKLDFEFGCSVFYEMAPGSSLARRTLPILAKLKEALEPSIAPSK